MAFFNQYSLLLALVVGAVLVAASLWRWQRGHVLLRAGVMAWYVLGAVVLVLALRYPALDAGIQTVADVENIIQDGEPTFVMLYSNY